MSADRRPTLDQFIDHIVHYATVLGPDHVALGIDYFKGQVPVVPEATSAPWYDRAIADGSWSPESYPPPPYFYPAGIETPKGFPNLTARMLERGFSAEETGKVMGGNWLRVFEAVWGK